MIVIIRSCLVFLFIVWSSSVDSAVSKFVRITPENRSGHEVDFCIAESFSLPDTVRISLELPEKSTKVAWLVVAKEYVEPDRQEFRRILWELQPDFSPFDIVSRIMTAPDELLVQLDIPSPPRATYVDKLLMSRAYIYVDFPIAVDDGGNYYSIDLSTFEGVKDIDC